MVTIRIVNKMGTACHRANVVICYDRNQFTATLYDKEGRRDMILHIDPGQKIDVSIKFIMDPLSSISVNFEIAEFIDMVYYCRGDGIYRANPNKIGDIQKYVDFERTGSNDEQMPRENCDPSESFNRLGLNEKREWAEAANHLLRAEQESITGNVNQLSTLSDLFRINEEGFSKDGYVTKKEIRLSDGMAQPGGNSEGDREDQDLPQGKQDKTPENACQLSAESGGRRLLRSIHGTYLRAHKVEWKVDMASQAGSWEQWYIEDWGGKVVLKAIHSPGRFLRAFPDGAIDLMDRPETWIPFKNDDGSWSFQSIHGRWLSAKKNGSVSTEVNRKSWEHFWLLPW